MYPFFRFLAAKGGLLRSWYSREVLAQADLEEIQTVPPGKIRYSKKLTHSGVVVDIKSARQSNEISSGETMKQCSCW